MLKILNACISNSKKDDLTNVEFDFGIHEISFDDKKIFNFLCLKNQYLTSGTFSIDDLNIIDDVQKTSRLLAFKINSKVFTTLCVFELTEDFKNVGFNEFKKNLLELKGLPLTSSEEIANKIIFICDAINKAKPIYLTIDMNDNVNLIHKEIILDKIQNLEINYIFVLKELIKQEIVRENLIEEEIETNIHNFATATMTSLPIVTEISTEDKSYEKEFDGFYSIDTGSADDKKKNNELIKDDNSKNKRLDLKMISTFTLLLIKNINLYYVFVFVFSFFVGLGALSGPYLIRTDHMSIGVVLIILFVLFTFVDAYIFASTYAGVKKHLDRPYKVLLYILLFLLATIAGLGASFGGLFLLNSLNATIVWSEFVTEDYIVSFIAFPLVVILCLCSSLLGKLYVVWHKFKSKHFPKKGQ